MIMTVFAPQFPPREPLLQLSVAQYHEMVERGILTEDDPVELLEGWLITKMPKNPPHAVATDLVSDKLNEVKPAGWSIRTQDPITTEDSEPEPDVVLVRGSRRDYSQRHPGPSDLALVVEVADFTLERDRTIKKRAYARARIVEYWIVNLVERTVEVHREPTGPVARPDFASVTTAHEGDSVAVFIEGREIARIAVADLLP